MSTIKKLDGRSAVNDKNLDRASGQITKAATGGRKLNETQLNGLVKFLDKALPKLNSPGQRSSPISDSVNYIDALNLKNEAVALLNKAAHPTPGRTGGGERTTPVFTPPVRTGGGERSGGGGGGGSIGGGER
ncbi:MAG: hypothetical protein Q8O67_19030 [Deltaproteobacteria bacterium]|nr:hypothetical protein [Deltaproteobacteria bacterium]